MKLGTILAALTAATIGTASVSALAQTASTPPTPNPNAVQKSFRTQNSSEQQSTSQSTTPMEFGPVGRSRSPN